MITVLVVKSFSDGTQESVRVEPGTTLGQLGAKVGAPANSTYILNRVVVNDKSVVLGEGDRVNINVAKFDAGC